VTWSALSLLPPGVNQAARHAAFAALVKDLKAAVNQAAA
jgi:hypothetical protein